MIDASRAAVGGAGRATDDDTAGVAAVAEEEEEEKRAALSLASSAWISDCVWGGFYTFAG